MQSTSVDENGLALIFDRDSHFGKTGDRGETVCALQEAVDFGQSVRKEPNMTLRWEMDLSPGTVSSPRREDVWVNFIEFIVVPA